MGMGSSSQDLAGDISTFKLHNSTVVSSVFMQQKFVLLPGYFSFAVLCHLGLLFIYRRSMHVACSPICSACMLLAVPFVVLACCLQSHLWSMHVACSPICRACMLLAVPFVVIVCCLQSHLWSMHVACSSICRACMLLAVPFVEHACCLQSHFVEHSCCLQFHL